MVGIGELRSKLHISKEILTARPLIHEIMSLTSHGFGIFSVLNFNPGMASNSFDKNASEIAKI